jgi:hypothetical protein
VDLVARAPTTASTLLGMPAGDPRGQPKQASEITVADLRKASDELQSLIDERVPRAFDNAKGVSWPTIALAFLARMASTVDAITTLAEHGRVLDGQALLRSLYEHAVTICWIAIDPPKHLPEWMAVSEQKYRALYHDAKRFGHEIMSAEAADQLGTPERKWQLDKRAEEVDDFWSPRIDAFRPPSWDSEGLLTFRGMYLGIFRPASRIVHAEPWSIDPLYRVSRSQVVVTEENYSFDPLPLSIPLMALCLLVHRHHFGWPDEEQAKGLSDRLLYSAPDQEASDSSHGWPQRWPQPVVCASAWREKTLPERGFR